MYSFMNVYNLVTTTLKVGNFKPITGRNGPFGFEFSFLSEDGKVIGTAHDYADGGQSFTNFKSKEDAERFATIVKEIAAQGWIIKTDHFGDLPVDKDSMVLGELAEALRNMKKYGGKKRQERMVAILGSDACSWKLADTAANRLRVKLPDGAVFLFRDPIQ